MRPAAVVHRAADYLARHDVESPLPTAEILMASVLGIDRAEAIRISAVGGGALHIVAGQVVRRRR